MQVVWRLCKQLAESLQTNTKMCRISPSETEKRLIRFYEVLRLPPYVIFANKWMIGSPPVLELSKLRLSAYGQMVRSSWIWGKCIWPRSLAKCHIFIDGHVNHWVVEAIGFVRDNGVEFAEQVMWWGEIVETGIVDVENVIRIYDVHHYVEHIRRTLIERR